MKKSLLIRILAVLIIPATIMGGLRLDQPKQAQAATAAELRTKSSQLQAEIKANQEQVKHLSHEVATLKDRLTQINVDIETTTKQIELTGIKVNETGNQAQRNRS